MKWKISEDAVNGNLYSGPMDVSANITFNICRRGIAEAVETENGFRMSIECLGAEW